MSEIEKVKIDDGSIKARYVAFCDVLGFSNAVENDFSAAAQIYVDFVNSVRSMGTFCSAQVTVYSDSILVMGDELAPVLSTVQMLWWAALLNNWLIRGGIAYGNVWQIQEGSDLFIVSEPLVKAAKIEKTIRVPAIQISPDIQIPEEYWVQRFATDLLSTPLLHFGGMNIVNPFNRYWFQSARTRVQQLLDQYPQHSDKYYWFLALADAVEMNQSLVPQHVIESLQKQGIIEFVPNGSSG